MENCHIILLLNRESAYGREVMRGVMSYIRPTRTWKVSIGRLDMRNAQKLISLKPDGIIAEVFSLHLEKILNESSIPYLDVSESVSTITDRKVCADNRKIGQLAAKHFLERGFTNFAYFGGKNIHFAKLREVGFAETLHECGLNYSVFRKRLRLDFYGSNVLGEISTRFYQWLRSLPKPAAIFTCNDAYALIVNESCRQLGFHVPDDIAILGVDNDEQFCQLEAPALSSIELPARQIGLEAAAMLDDLIHDKPLSRSPKIIPPLGIVLRQSTDIVAIEDNKLAAAIKFIREHADSPITVNDICKALYISRRSLETSMKKQLGHTPLAEINRNHIERAKTLLLNTDMQMPNIASSSGFNSPERMSVVFKKLAGITPSQYRKRFSPNSLKTR